MFTGVAEMEGSRYRLRPRRRLVPMISLLPRLEAIIVLLRERVGRPPPPRGIRTIRTLAASSRSVS